MNTIVELYSKLTTGIVVFKESLNGGNAYLYATRNLDYLQSILNAADYQKFISKIDEESRETPVYDRLEGFYVYDIQNSKSFVLKPHFFTGVCEFVAYTKAPEYRNYPEMLINLKDRRSTNSDSLDTEEIEIHFLSYLSEHYKSTSRGLSALTNLNIELHLTGTDQPLKIQTITQENGLNGTLELIFFEDKGETHLLKLPKAALSALFLGNELSVPDERKKSIDVCFYVKQEYLSETLERLQANNVSTDRDSVINFLINENSSDFSTDVEELLEMGKEESIVVGEQFGYMDMNPVTGAVFYSNEQPTYSKRCVALKILHPNGRVDWEFYLLADSKQIQHEAA